MPIDIVRLAEKYLNNPKRVLIDSDDLSGKGIEQSFLVIKDREKQKYLSKFIKENKKGQTIVFCSTKIRTRNVSRELQKARFHVVSIEGDMSQNKREYSMTKFRKNNVDILVATDVAARGIDVPKVGLVVNYDVPNQEEVVAQVTIPSNKVREIVMNFFNKKNYAQRRKWLKKNLTEIDVYRLDNPDEHSNE